MTASLSGSACAGPERVFGEWIDVTRVQFRIAAESLGQDFIGFAGGGRRRQAAQEFVGEVEPILVGQAESRCFDFRELGHVRKLIAAGCRSRRGINPQAVTKDCFNRKSERDDLSVGSPRPWVCARGEV